MKVWAEGTTPRGGTGSGPREAETDVGREKRKSGGGETIVRLRRRQEEVE